MSLIGGHVSIAGGLEKAIIRGEELGCEAIQIFTSNQLRWARRGITDARCDKFQIEWRRSHIGKVVAHCSYLINLASSGTLRQKSINTMIEEIKACDRLGIDDIVVHPGFRGNLERKESLERVKDALSTIMGKTLNTRVRINLESMAGSGTVIGSTLEELSDILYGLSDNDRTGICLDTAHLYASGYDLGSSEAYDRFRSRLLSLFEPDYVACWHLNDSSRELGSNIDRHENIGEGYLGLQVFGSIINDPLWEDVPCILETPKSSNGDRKNLSILRKLRGG